jgi:glycosyltransferase involved in cell wall biosynthesis
LKIKLPNLETYREEYLAKGLELPLRPVKTPLPGLLKAFPGAPKDKTGWPWTEQVDPSIYARHTNWPKLTIVTPSYNQAQFIEQTVRSVLLQNYPNLEYIVIDGGSTDNTREILEKYSPWLSYWQSEKDNGQSHAINVGFSLATGAYRAWINSDDYYLNGAFLKVIKAFLAYNVSFVYGYALNYNVYSQQFSPVKVLPVLDYFIRLPWLAQPSCFWAAAIHQPIWEQLHCSLDYELWLRMVKGNTRKLLKEPLSVATTHANAKTSNPVMSEQWQKDHELICSADAHGAVANWNTLIALNKLYVMANRLFSKKILVP